MAAGIGQSGVMPPTRRERVRAETIDEIKQAALAQIATSGAPALSIRGVARAIGMSPAGLYRYFDGLEALLTELIADAYNDLADAVVASGAEQDDPLGALRAAMIAYRRWSVTYPNRFLLIFGSPIPGYAAPEGGPTVAANRRIGEAFFTPIAEAWQLGLLAPPPPDATPIGGERELAQLIDAEFPPALVGSYMSVWAHFHGMVTLEILNQLDWIYPEPEIVYEREVDNIVEQLAAGSLPELTKR
jgi:AcrR family transcriptional regulator